MIQFSKYRNHPKNKPHIFKQQGTWVVIRRVKYGLLTNKEAAALRWVFRQNSPLYGQWEKVWRTREQATDLSVSRPSGPSMRDLISAGYLEPPLPPANNFRCAVRPINFGDSNDEKTK